MEIIGQNKCITWSINVGVFDQVYNAVIKYIEDRQGGFFEIVLLDQLRRKELRVSIARGGEGLEANLVVGIKKGDF